VAISSQTAELMARGVPSSLATYLDEIIVTTVSPHTFGAMGDGVTDDTTAIQRAINETEAAGGGILFFPTGTYVITNLIIDSPNVQLIGNGNSSILRSSDSTQHLITLKANHCGFKDLRFEGAAINGTNSTFAIFTATANPATHCKVQNCVFSGATSSYGFNSGVKFDDDCNYGLVSNCLFERLQGTASGRGYGVLNNGDNCQVVNNRFLGTTNRGRHAIYVVSGASYCNINNNYIESFDYEGISQNSTGTQPACVQNSYIGNALVTCVTTANPNSGAIGLYGHASGCCILGNQVKTSGAIGLALDGTDVTDMKYCSVIGNTILNSYFHGIRFIAVGISTIGNNVVYESGQASAGDYPNIAVISDGVTACDQITIVGNHSTGATKARSALTVNSTAPVPTNTRIIGNYFPACVGYSIEKGTPCAVDGFWGKDTTVNRPTPLAADIGHFYLDTTLDADGLPVWWQGTKWIKADGSDA
jgi:hypothetical protein